MAKQVRLRRGTTAQHATFTGADGEITFDTDKKCVVTHDGITPGGRAVTGWLDLNPASPSTVQELKGGLRVSGDDGDQRGLFVDQNAYVVGNLISGAFLSAPQYRRSVELLTYGAVVDLTFAYERKRLILAGDVVFTAAAYDPGSHLVVVVEADASPRNLSFPAGWQFVGGVRPTTIAAGKVGLLELFCVTHLEANVVARWSVET
jgi:hypothetical protein